MLQKRLRQIMTVLLAICVAGCFGLSFDTSSAYAAKTVKAKSVSLNHKVYTLKKGKKVKLKAIVSPKNSTQKQIIWTSSNKKVATVKNGKVKAVAKKGKVTITATVKGSKKKAKATIYVGTPVKKAVFDMTALTMTRGESKSAGAKLNPEKATVKGITYKSSNPLVASVNSNGTIVAVGAGEAVITATPVDEAGKAAKLKVTVKNPENAAPTPAPAPAPTPTPTPAPASAADKVTVSSTEELTKALTDSSIKEITIGSNAADIEIPEGNYAGKVLIVDAPNGHIENKGIFDSVQILAVSESSFVEYASGNFIRFLAVSGRLRVEKNANTSIDVNSDGSNLNLVVNGNIRELNILKKANLDISGASNNPVPVNIDSDAEDSRISTSNELNVNTEAKVGLNILAGAEYTQVNIQNAASEDEAETLVPVVWGLGLIRISYDESHFRNVVAQNNNNDNETKKITLEGKVQTAGGQGVAGMDVSVIPFEKEMTSEELEDAAESAADSAVYNTETDSKGEYSVSNVKVGNYYLLVRNENYVSENVKLIITSNNEKKYIAPAVTVSNKNDAEKKGCLSGVIRDDSTGETAEEGLTVILRKGGNNISGNILETTNTDAKGAFSFSGEYEFGQYTVEVVDNRKQDKQYAATSFNAIISKEGDNEANSSATPTIQSEQVRFVLSWGNEASGASADLDSHLVGPSADGKSVFHTWYSDMNYYEEEGAAATKIRYANLDVDDVDYEGPETTTIYRKTEGTYSFYVQDFTNLDNKKSSQMSASSAVVKVYVGANLRETYNVPTNKAGILWHVCDYDAAKNKIVTGSGIDSKWDGQPEEVGLSKEQILESAKDDLREIIEEAQNLLASLDDGETKTEGAKLIADGNEALKTDDLDAVRSAGSSLNDWVDGVKNVFGIVSVTAYTGETDEYGKPIDLISEWSDYDEIDEATGEYRYSELLIYGSEETMPENITVAFRNKSVSTGGLVACTDKEGYTHKLTASLDGKTKTWYVRYKMDEDILLGVKGATKIVSAGDDGSEKELIDYIDTNRIYPDDEDEVPYYTLTVYGSTAELPENIEFILRNKNASCEFDENVEKEGYIGKLTVSASTGGISVSRVYYVRYELSYTMKFGYTLSDSDGNELSYSWIGGEDDGTTEYYALYTHTAGVPDITVKCSFEGTTADLSESDKEDYDLKLTLTYGAESMTYYFKCCPILQVDKVISRGGGDGGEDIDLTVEQYYGSGDSEIRIYGITDDMPENLEFVPHVEGTKCTFTKSTDGGYEGTLTLTLGGRTEIYHVEYVISGYEEFTPSSVADPSLAYDYSAATEIFDFDSGQCYPVKMITGVQENLPEDVEFICGKYVSELTAADSDVDGYVKKITYKKHGKTYICYIGYTQRADEESEMKVAMITDGGSLEDQSFNQTTYEACSAFCNASGMTSFRAECPSDADDDGDIEDEEILAAINSVIGDGYNVIVMAGFMAAGPVRQAAPENPNVKFIVLDATQDDFGKGFEASNVCSVSYQEEVAGYMAGYAAVKLGYTKLGFLGGMAVPAVQRYGHGFVQGADAAAEELGKNDVEIKYVYGGQFFGDADITAAMDTWYGAGTECVFACGGGIYSSAAEAAAKTGGKVIGVDVDQKYTIDGQYGDGMTVTSAMKGLAPTVNTLLRAIMAGEWAEYAGTFPVLGVASEDPAESYVQLSGSTQFGDGFTTDDYAELVRDLYDGTKTVSNDTTNIPETTAVKVTNQGSIKN